jgi:hypothetical protein
VLTHSQLLLNLRRLSEHFGRRNFRTFEFLANNGQADKPPEHKEELTDSGSISGSHCYRHWTAARL